MLILTKCCWLDLDIYALFDLMVLLGATLYAFIDVLVLIEGLHVYACVDLLVLIELLYVYACVDLMVVVGRPHITPGPTRGINATK